MNTSEQKAKINERLKEIAVRKQEIEWELEDAPVSRGRDECQGFYINSYDEDIWGEHQDLEEEEGELIEELEYVEAVEAEED